MISFVLYSFHPDAVYVDGYVYHGQFDSVPECDEFAAGMDFYRIERITDYGACLVFESSWEAI
jgi:hypothetical protein